MNNAVRAGNTSAVTQVRTLRRRISRQATCTADNVMYRRGKPRCLRAERRIVARAYGLLRAGCCAVEACWRAG